MIDESNTSSYCPICGIRGRRMYRGLFYCKKCGKKMNADVVGTLNIAKKMWSKNTLKHKATSKIHKNKGNNNTEKK